jgi:hypothetical protein
MFAAAAAEGLGVWLTMLTVDKWGRSRSQFIWYIACGVFTPLMAIQHEGGGFTFVVLLLLGMGARSSIMAASSVTWVATPEAYPTAVR